MKNLSEKSPSDKSLSPQPEEIQSDENSIPHKGHTNHVTFQRTYRVTYLGFAVLDRRYTLPMLPWIIAETKRYGLHTAESVYLEVTESSLKAVAIEDSNFMFEHKLQNISKFAQTSHDHKCFTYLTKEAPDGPTVCHVYQAPDENTVLELFTTMREMTKEMSNCQGFGIQLARTASGIALDTMLVNSHQFEVMYVGRIKVSQKRAPPAFIDDSVEKFRLYELEKFKNMQKGRQRHGSGTSVMSLPHTLDILEHASENQLVNQTLKTCGSNYSSKETLTSTSEQSSIENVAEEYSESFSKESSTESDCNPLLQSPISPLGSVDQLNRVSSNFISHTQSLDHNTSSTLLQSLKEYEGKSSAFQPSLHLPSLSLKHTQSLDTVGQIAMNSELPDSGLSSSRVRSCSGDIPRACKQNSLPVYRVRVGSGGNSDLKRPHLNSHLSVNSKQQHNRTMLFLIGRLDLCLISTDKKQVLLNKMFSDIAHCSQGVKNLDHFGFICRETTTAGTDCYTGYVFRCQTEKVVDELMQALKHAFQRAHQEYQQQVSRNQTMTCETCPMHWFHKLCSDSESLAPDDADSIILQRISTLNTEEKEDIMRKFHDTSPNSLQEQNEIFMMLLRNLCEQKQKAHKHTLNGNQSNSNELGTFRDKTSASKLDSLRQKAKKSLSNSLETILKRKGRDELSRDRASTVGDPSFRNFPETPDKHSARYERFFREGSYDASESDANGRISPFSQRPRSSTISSSSEVQKEAARKISTERKPKMTDLTPPNKSPIMNIFMKVGSQSKVSSCNNVGSPSTPKGSWRQAMFHRVQTPIQQSKSLLGNLSKDELTEVISDELIRPARRTKAELRALWKKAIMEQILLIRMEKENKKLQVKQDAATSKRMKLDYEEISPCLKQCSLRWENLLTSSDRPKTKMNMSELQDLVKTGIPRHKRGDIWQFLAEQYNLHFGVPASDTCIDTTIPYEELLKQLTSHQHSILIDLGRTFPNHPFYCQPLGPGQLALFNLLKAYSLLDKEVGYCQGLSFVAGILLLHMPEEKAFHMMKHILFNLGFRKQYKPDMVALQIQLYQLSRLLHDNYREVYEHLDKYEIAPTLYAAPWFLTLFASQFSLGFVSRLFDLVLLQGTDAIFKVAVVLLGNHRDIILQLHGFEVIMEFLKTSLPSIGIIEMERLFNQVFLLDVSKQLQAYEVEYHVLREEMLQGPPKSEIAAIEKLEASNKSLKQQNMELLEQLHVAQCTVSNLEASVLSHQSTVKRLEDRVRILEDEREALLHSVKVMRMKLEKIEVSHLNSDERTPSLGVITSLSREDSDEAALVQLVKDFAQQASCEQRKEDEEETSNGELFSSGILKRTISNESTESVHSNEFGGSL